MHIHTHPLIILCGSSLAILINVSSTHMWEWGNSIISIYLWHHRVVVLCHYNFKSKAFFLRSGGNALEDKFSILSIYETQDERDLCIQSPTHILMDTVSITVSHPHMMFNKGTVWEVKPLKGSWRSKEMHRHKVSQRCNCQTLFSSCSLSPLHHLKSPLQSTPEFWHSYLVLPPRVYRP